MTDRSSPPDTALRALYEWYDRDGSVGGASEVFEAHRSALSGVAQEPEPLESFHEEIRGAVLEAVEVFRADPIQNVKEVHRILAEGARRAGLAQSTYHEGYVDGVEDQKQYHSPQSTADGMEWRLKKGIEEIKWLMTCQRPPRIHDALYICDALLCNYNEGSFSSTDCCAKCGFPKSEHHYNGACYGVCGEFASTDRREPLDGEEAIKEAARQSALTNRVYRSDGDLWTDSPINLSKFVRLLALSTVPSTDQRVPFVCDS